MSLLAEDIGDMPRMRSVDKRVSALLMVVEIPSARKGYEDLATSYELMSMSDEADCVRFLVSEKFDADDSLARKEQL